VTCEEARFSANFTGSASTPAWADRDICRVRRAAAVRLLFLIRPAHIPAATAVASSADQLVALRRCSARRLLLKSRIRAARRHRHPRDVAARLCRGVEAATERELVEQDRLRRTEDMQEASRPMPSVAYRISRDASLGRGSDDRYRNHRFPAAGLGRGHPCRLAGRS